MLMLLVMRRLRVRTHDGQGLLLFGRCSYIVERWGLGRLKVIVMVRRVRWGWSVWRVAIVGVLRRSLGVLGVVRRMATVAIVRGIDVRRRRAMRCMTV